MFIKPTKRQMRAVGRLGVRIPPDADRYQVRALIDEAVGKLKASAEKFLDSAGVRQHVLVDYQNELWVVLAPPTTRHLCLKEYRGGEKAIIPPTGRTREGDVYLRVEVRYTPPDGFVHPFSVESDSRLAGTPHLLTILQKLREVLPRDAQLETGYGTYWRGQSVERVIESHFSDLKQRQVAAREAEKADLEAEQAQKAVRSDAYCITCAGDLEATPLGDRRCADCREDAVIATKERYCFSCGALFTLNTDGAGRWHCAIHNLST